MQEYIERLVKCGFSLPTAYLVYHDLLNMSLRCPEYSLEEFIEELEAQPSCG